MAELIKDILIPKTDQAVFVQAGIVLVFWLIVFMLTRRLQREYRVFLLGLFVFNLGFFALRSLH